MKYTYKLLAMLCALTGCNTNHLSSRYTTPEIYMQPQTNKEIAYEQSLKSRGYSNVKYEIPIPGKGPTIGRGYWLTLRSDSVFYMSPDSLPLIRRSIANELYNDIMSDEEIYDILEIGVCICKDDLNHDVFLCDEYPKDSMEIWNGFKVVQLPTGYKRVPLKE